MRAFICTLGGVFTSFVLVGCGPSLDNACGLSGGVPGDGAPAAGTLQASLDGSPFTQADATWSDDSNGSLVAGTLTIVIAVDETGTSVGELVGRRAFPICVPLGERSETSGQATFDSAFVTSATSTGSLSILDEADGVITGRFQVDLTSGGGDARAFDDGVFRASLR